MLLNTYRDRFSYPQKIALNNAFRPAKINPQIHASYYFITFLYKFFHQHINTRPKKKKKMIKNCSQTFKIITSPLY